MKNAKLTTLICGLISIAATVIFYLLTFDSIFNVPMRWVSLMFLLIVEVIGTLKALFVKQNLFMQATIFTGIGHLVVVLGLSVIFVNFFPLAIKTYILLNILVFCVVAIVDLLVMHFGKSTSAGNKVLAQSQAVMDTCYAKAQELATAYGQSEYKDELVAIAELIKYSDNSELTGDEPVIMSKLGELENLLKEGNATASGLIGEIKNGINLRTMKMKSLKRGGY